MHLYILDKIINFYEEEGLKINSKEILTETFKQLKKLNPELDKKDIVTNMLYAIFNEENLSNNILSSKDRYFYENVTDFLKEQNLLKSHYYHITESLFMLHDDSHRAILSFANLTNSQDVFEIPSTTFDIIQSHFVLYPNYLTSTLYSDFHNKLILKNDETHQEEPLTTIYKHCKFVRSLDPVLLLNNEWKENHFKSQDAPFFHDTIVELFFEELEDYLKDFGDNLSFLEQKTFREKMDFAMIVNPVLFFEKLEQQNDLVNKQVESLIFNEVFNHQKNFIPHKIMLNNINDVIYGKTEEQVKNIALSEFIYRNLELDERILELKENKIHHYFFGIAYKYVTKENLEQFKENFEKIKNNNLENKIEEKIKRSEQNQKQNFLNK